MKAAVINEFGDIDVLKYEDNRKLYTYWLARPRPPP